MSIYAHTARFDSAHALTEDELRAQVPSIFATEAHHSRSDRFAPIPTIDLLRGLSKEGFAAVGAKQCVVRVDERRNFTKHMIRLRRLGDTSLQIGDTVCEMLLKNANDGTSVYDLMAGLFRIRCMNSLVVQTGTIDAVKVRHSGDVMPKVIEGTYRVLSNAQKALVAPTEWSRQMLSQEEREAFAEAAHVVRFSDTDGNVTTPIQPRQLLIPRRYNDNGTDLWTTSNVVQENAIRGGLTAVGHDANNRLRRTTTRGIKSIDQDVRINKALWVLAERMAQIKVAA